MQNAFRKSNFLCVLLLWVVASAASASSVTDNWSELIQAPPTTADQQQRDRFMSFNEALVNESFSEAEIAAKQMIESVDADAIDAVPARARALQNLAIAQQVQGSHESAIQNYQAALNLIASEEDNLSPSLILPLRGLAIVHLDTGRTDEAFAVFDRAVHVSNVNYGPHSLKQLPILNTKLQVYLELDDPRSALDMLDRIYMLYTRKYSRDSEELLPALYQKAELYGQLNMSREAYRAWRHILAIKRAHHDENDVELIEPNIRMAEHSIGALRVAVYRAVTTSNAEKHLKRALWIAENSPESNWEVRKDCLLALADYYTLFDLRGRAHRHYLAAWNLMSSNEVYLVARAEDLELPVPLSRPKPDPYTNFEYNPDREKITPDDYLEGELVMAFTINDHGRTEQHRVVEASPPNFYRMELRVRNAVKQFVYRPRYVDGVAADTGDQQYRLKYFYLPLDYEAEISKSHRRGGLITKK
jgi:tetratricopeptide (TPR) repeat protein